ncbi:MAG: ParA family protein [Ktedonobacterales bacterium]|nr:ParA family protein [Ktedonobacterales bacterium]
MPGTRIFAIANQKGGVGKTTTTINLAAYLANAGRRTLVVDLDPQSNTTTGFGFEAHDGPGAQPGLAASDPRKVNQSIYELLVTEGITPAEVTKAHPDLQNLWLLPAKVDLYAADLELLYMEERERRLERILGTLKPNYDIVLIDCPPSLGLLTVNALTAADGVILPLQCEYFALEGMRQLLKSIKLVHDRLNPRIHLFGVVLTMFDSRTKLAGEVVSEISQHFPREKFEAIIPRSVRLAEAPSYGKTILEHDPRSPGALAYKRLAEEVIARAAVMETIHA